MSKLSDRWAGATLGTWIVKHAGSADEIWSDRGMIAELSLYPHGSRVAGDNARLIADAPLLPRAVELLEALLRAFECHIATSDKVSLTTKSDYLLTEEAQAFLDEIRSLHHG